VTDDIKISGKINSVEVFLAHALTLENEAADGYQEIGDSMAVHNNPKVAAMFFKMAKYGRLHAAEVRELAAELTLPHIAPWEFAWQDGNSPEAPSMANVDYMIRPAEALALALRAEQQAHDFYAAVAGASEDPRIRELAAQFAGEEAEHVRLLSEWIAKVPAGDGTADFDPDPPASPE